MASNADIITQSGTTTPFNISSNSLPWAMLDKNATVTTAGNIYEDYIETMAKRMSVGTMREVESKMVKDIYSVMQPVHMTHNEQLEGKKQTAINDHINSTSGELKKVYTYIKNHYSTLTRRVIEDVASIPILSKKELSTGSALMSEINKELKLINQSGCKSIEEVEDKLKGVLAKKYEL